MKFYIFVVFLSVASAHVPIFPEFSGEPDVGNAFDIEDIDKKSWGVYGTLKKPVWLRMNATKGDRLTLSLQRGKLRDPDKDGNYDIGLFGPGLNSINCSTGWYGWSHSTDGGFFTRDITDLSTFIQEKVYAYGHNGYPNLLKPPIVVHGDGSEPTEFEPFGVGLYWPIGGCNATWPETATYYVVITAPPDTPEEISSKIHYSLGVGMIESFTVGELLRMPFLILHTFEWGGSSGITMPVLIVIALGCFMLRVLTVQLYTPIGFRGWFSLIGIYMIWFGAAFYVGSAAAFISQLIWCYVNKDTSTDIGASVAIPLVVHIILPLIIGTVILLYFYANRQNGLIKNVLVVIAGVYGLFLVWQGFIAFPLLLIIGGLLRIVF